MSEIFWVISESSETLQLQSEIYKHCLLYLLELELEYIQQFPLVETECLQGKERYNLRKWGEEWYKPQGVVGCNLEWVESNGFGSSNQFELTRGLGLLWVNFPVVHDSPEAAWVKVTLSYSIWQWVEWSWLWKFTPPSRTVFTQYICCPEKKPMLSEFSIWNKEAAYYGSHNMHIYFIGSQ